VTTRYAVLLRHVALCGKGFRGSAKTVTGEVIYYPRLSQLENSMAELKTKRTEASPRDFLNAIKDEQVRKDCQAVAKIMEEATKARPKMWGPAIVGFGSYRYKYPDGREMDWMLIAFSPRKNYIALYIKSGFESYKDLMSKLGKHSGSKSCINIKRLADIDMPTLKKLVKASVAHVRKVSKG
jgi:hypothetical protein